VESGGGAEGAATDDYNVCVNVLVR